MKGLLFFLVLFFALCYSTDVYLTAYSAPSCDAATGYIVLKFALTSGSCFNSDAGGGLLLNTDGSVSFFSSTNCSGNLSFSVASGSACTNGTFSGSQSFSQIVPSGVYILFDEYQNQNCSTPTYPYSTYALNGTCSPVSTTPPVSSAFFFAAPAPNFTIYYYASSLHCSGSSISLNLVPGCNTFSGTYVNLGIQNLPAPITSTGTSVTGTSVTGTSVTGTSVTGSSSTTGASGSTTGSRSSNDSNVFYPSLFLLVSLFLTSLF